MIKAERQDKIKQMVENLNSVAVKDIATTLNVSEMTVRRDLKEMSALGELTRVHGGACSNFEPRHSMLRVEHSHTEKRLRHISEKTSIAKLAASLIEPHSTIFLGVSTTVELMVQYLPPVHLRIVTNSLSIFNLIEGRPECDLCLVGGIYRPRSGAFVGPLAEDFISKIGLDAAFLGANGVYDHLASTSNVEEGHLQRSVFDQADARYLLLDASKIGKRDFYNFYDLSDLNALICNEDIDGVARAQIEDYTNLMIQ